MRIQLQLGVMTALFLVAASAHANGEGFGRCKEGFSEDTRVETEFRGDLTIGEVLVNDRVWSFNEIVGKPGWSRVLRRSEGARHYRLFVDFTEPESTQVTKACWLIKRMS